ncbi:hypothetical protein BH23GEM9_BH23GEM9_37490 [soil metagenome]
MPYKMASRSGPRRQVPVQAGILSLACLAIPIAATGLWGGELGQYELLLWMSALLPPFLLAYYRGWSGAAVALAAGMAALSIAHAGMIWRGGPVISWWIPVAVSMPLILVSLGAGWLSDLLWKKVLLAERNAAELALAVDASSLIHFASPSAERFLGYAPAQAKGRLLTDLVDSTESGAALIRLLEQNGADGESIEVDFRHAAGGTRTLELVAGVASRAADRGLIILIARDVTSRRGAEEQLRRLHTMRTVGRIVGGVANETNNLIMAVNGHVHALHEAVNPADLRRLEVEALQTSGDRVGALMRQLVGFTRQSDLKVQPVFLNGFIQHRMSLLQNLLPKGVELNVAFADEGGFISVDPVGLTEAVTSIVCNAGDATRIGDEVSIRTYRDVIEEQKSGAYPYPVRTGDYLVIEIRDNGMGMTEDVLNRAMEPFFTTRTPARSRGLGLSAAYGFFKQSGGYLWLTSAPGQGTTATICLPEIHVVDQADDLGGVLPTAVSDAPGCVRTVLLVEDEPLVLSYMRSVLLREGYFVLEATDGRDALQQFSKSNVDVLVADIALPHVTGDELLRQLRISRPTLPAVLTSGSTMSELLGGDLFDGPTDLLEKPFSPPELLASLERVQERAGSELVGGPI